MNIEKYTERSRGFIQSAQSLAVREGHQQFSSLHLLKVLLDDNEGLADLKADAWQRFAGKAFYRITIKACDLCWAQGHRALLGDSCALVSRIHRTRATAHEFVKTPLPFPESPSHISGDGRVRLTNVNAVRGYPMKMPQSCLRDGRGMPRE